MSNTEQTKKAIDEWDSQQMRNMRVNYLREIARDAGIIEAFDMLPMIHLETMNYTTYTITLQGLAKIRELRRIADK